jgi:hypothetical protein
VEALRLLRERLKSTRDESVHLPADRWAAIQSQMDDLSGTDSSP